MNDIGQHIRAAHKNLNLVELVVRESIDGFQAIVKFDQTRTGPWGVGTDGDPILAIEKALAAGARELQTLRRRAEPKKPAHFEDLLG